MRAHLFLPDLPTIDPHSKVTARTLRNLQIRLLGREMTRGHSSGLTQSRMGPADQQTALLRESRPDVVIWLESDGESVEGAAFPGMRRIVDGLMLDVDPKAGPEAGSGCVADVWLESAPPHAGAPFSLPPIYLPRLPRRNARASVILAGDFTDREIQLRVVRLLDRLRGCAGLQVHLLHRKDNRYECFPEQLRTAFSQDAQLQIRPVLRCGWRHLLSLMASCCLTVPMDLGSSAGTPLEFYETGLRLAAHQFMLFDALSPLAMDLSASGLGKDLTGLTTSAEAFATHVAQAVIDSGATWGDHWDALDQFVERLRKLERFRALQLRALMTGGYRAPHDRARDIGKLPHVLVISSVHVGARVRPALEEMVRSGRIGGFANLVDVDDQEEWQIDVSVGVMAGTAFDCVIVEGNLSPLTADTILALDDKFIFNAGGTLYASGDPAALFGFDRSMALARRATAVTVPSIAAGRIVSALAGLPRSAPIHFVPAPLVGPRPSLVPGRKLAGLLVDGRDVDRGGDELAPVIDALLRFCTVTRVPLLLQGETCRTQLTGSDVVRRIAGDSSLSTIGLLPKDGRVIPVVPLLDAGNVAFQAANLFRSDHDLAFYGAHGLPGVYSAAGPYFGTSLPGASIVANDPASWLEALDLQARKTPSPEDADEIWESRRADRLVDIHWVGLLNRGRLCRPVSIEALRSLRARLKRYGYEARFDEAAYLAANHDVQVAITQGGLASGLDHYMRFGRWEGRHPNVTPVRLKSFREVAGKEIEAARGKLGTYRKKLAELVGQ